MQNRRRYSQLFKTIEEEHNIDVQLSRSHANAQVNQETYFKVTFIDRNTGRNHPHIDYGMKFQNSGGELLNITRGYTVEMVQVLELYV
jgi:hypothetical protein